MKEKLKKTFSIVLWLVLVVGVYILVLYLADIWNQSKFDKEFKDIKSFCEELFNPNEPRYDKCFDRAREIFYPDPPQLN